MDPSTNVLCPQWSLLREPFVEKAESGLFRTIAASR